MLPPAIITALVRFGPFLDDTGKPFTGDVVFTASRPRVWEATGTPVLPRGLRVPLDETGSGEIRLPATDQPGFTDGVGNAVTNWTIKAEVRLSERENETRSFALPTGGQTDAVIDLDLLTPVPSSTGVVVELPAVYSVAGESGAVSAQTLASRVAPFLPPSGLDDAGVAAKIADPTSATGAATVVSTGRVATLIPLASYLLPGEIMPDNGVADAAPLLQRAIDDLVAKSVANPASRFVLGVPAGRFRHTTSLRMRHATTPATVERIGIKGAGMSETIFLPVGTSSGFVVISPGPDIAAARDHYYSDFTIDLIGSTHPDPTEATYKGFIGRGYIDCYFGRVTVRNSPATAFGVDYPVRVVFQDCHVVRTGQGKNGGNYNPAIGPSDAAKSISGFGIGFGLFPAESMTLIGCTATDCQRAGFFFETFDYDRGYDIRNAVINLIGCRADNNRIGYSNVGASGVSAINCQATDNSVAGYYAGMSGNVQTISSMNDTLINCDFLRNGIGLYANGDHTGLGHNFKALFPALGGYRILDCHFDDNTGPGLLAERFLDIEAGGMVVRGNTFRRNTGPGIHLRQTVNPLRDVVIAGNYFDSNTGPAIKAHSAMTAPKFSDNTVVTAGVGFEFHTAEPVTAPAVQGNTFRRVGTPMKNAARLDQTLITNNRIVTTANDPDVAPRLFTGIFYGPTSGQWPPTGEGWLKNTTGTSNNWDYATYGIRLSGSAVTGRSIIYRDFATTGLYVEGTISYMNGASSAAQMLGVALMPSASSGTALIAGVNGGDAALTTSSYYSLWKLVGGTMTRLWESTVPMGEKHAIALARRTGSTVTDIFIDGERVHTLDVPDVAATSNAAIFSKIVTGQNRLLSELRVMPYTPDA